MSDLSEASILYVVSTPIGNMADLSRRAKDVLATSSVIYAEDTRTARKLLQQCQIEAPRLESYHDHSDDQRRKQIIDVLSKEKTQAALISEAGTPCISDPGYKLIKGLKEAGVQVIAVPGASALLALAASAGLPTDRLVFLGFLPSKTEAVQKEVGNWVGYVRHSVLFFSSMKRLTRDLEIVSQFFPSALVAIGRELTKVYEEVRTAGISTSLEWLRQEAVLKGEVCVMVHLPESLQQVDPAVLQAEIEQEARARFAQGARMKELQKEFKDRGLGRNELYELLLRAKSGKN